MAQKKTRYLHLSVFIFMLGALPVAHAGLYKCKDSLGKITYSQKRCPDHAETDVLEMNNRGHIEKREYPPLGCYRLTTKAGESFDVTAFWTNDGATKDSVYGYVGSASMAIKSHKIRKIEFSETESNCRKGTITMAGGKQSAFKTCNTFFFRSSIGSGELSVLSVDSIAPCE